MSYLVGWNMPGYLPEMEPYEVETVQEGVEMILNEISMLYDQTEDNEEAAELMEVIESLRGTTELVEVEVCGYVYWVIPNVETE